MNGALVFGAFAFFVGLIIYEIARPNNLTISGVIGGIVGTKLSAAQIAQYAAAAGFQGNDLVTTVAVALAESGGDPNAYNPETAAGAPAGKGSYGLWQIYLNAHPEFAGQNLSDPQTNANAAFSVYRASGGSFTPWSTFNSGVYASNLDAAQTAVTNG